MRRFFTETTSISKSKATISGAEAKHIRQSLRLKPSETIEIFDGTGTVYLAQIQAITKDSVDAIIINSALEPPKTPFLSIGQSLIKPKNMDLLHQKLTELSVQSVYTFSSQFSDIKSVSGKQINRWERISLEACKQCKRPAPVICQPMVSFEQLLDQSRSFDQKILFWEKEQTHFLSSFKKFNQQAQSTLLVFGPEGGFSEVEVEQARTAGFITTSLGPLTLRAETAAIAAVSIVQHMLGNLSYTADINWDQKP